MNQSFAQRIRKEFPEETKFYAVEHQPTARAAMLELRTKAGVRDLFAYSYLTRATMDEDGNLILYISDNIVIIKGRCLEELFSHIQSNRLLYIQEDFSGIDAGEEKLFIEEISIKKQEL